MNKHIFVILLTAILLFVSTFPATAEAKPVPITGTCVILKEGGYDMPHDPRFRYWENSSGSVAHIRYALFLLGCDFSDDRLDSYFLSVDNWVFFSNGPFMGRDHALGYSSDEDGNPLDLWDITSDGYLDWEGNFTDHVVFKGRGPNQGLLANTTWTNIDEITFHVEGELIDPGE